jgi:UDP-N-acetylmuramate--alanine ligase
MKTLLNVPFSNVKHIHFIGIGGIGMSGIAALFYELGFSVQGSDLKESSSVDNLRNLGIKVVIGHTKENISNSDVIVISSAIKEDNEEYIEALRLGLPIFTRGKNASRTNAF